MLPNVFLRDANSLGILTIGAAAVLAGRLADAQTAGRPGKNDQDSARLVYLYLGM